MPPDELADLRTDATLAELLEHYVHLGEADRQCWHARRADLAELPPREVARRHGLLLANDWLELQVGATPACYRATAAGRRALRNVSSGTRRLP